MAHQNKHNQGHNQGHQQQKHSQQPQKHGNQPQTPQQASKQPQPAPKQTQPAPPEAQKPPSAAVAPAPNPGETRKRKRPPTPGEKLKKTNGLITYLRIDGPIVTPRNQHGEPQPVKQSKLPYGCLVAIDLNHIGWSRVSPKDQFDYERALVIAMGRAASAKPLGEFCQKLKQGGRIIVENVDDRVEKFILHKDLKTPVTMIFNLIAGRSLVRWESGHIVYEDSFGIPIMEHRVDMAIEIIEFYEFARKHFSGELARDREQKKLQDQKTAGQAPRPGSQGPIAGNPTPQTFKHTPPGNKSQSGGHTPQNKPQHDAMAKKR